MSFFGADTGGAIANLVYSGVVGGVEIYQQYQQLKAIEGSTRDARRLAQVRLQIAALEKQAVDMLEGRTDASAENMRKITRNVAIAGGAAIAGLLLFMQ